MNLFWTKNSDIYQFTGEDRKPIDQLNDLNIGEIETLDNEGLYFVCKPLDTTLFVSYLINNKGEILCDKYTEYQWDDGSLYAIKYNRSRSHPKRKKLKI